MHSLFQFVKAIIPHGLVEWRRTRLARKCAQDHDQAKTQFHKERYAKIASVRNTINGSRIHGCDYEAVIRFLIARGVPEFHLRDGSVTRESLEYIDQQILSQLPTDRPSYLLHIGNFVGVSLAYMAAAIMRQHKESQVVSVDPNIPHRGIANPQSHVAAILDACGLQHNTLVISGYSGKKSISNDGVNFGDYDPAREFKNEFACEDVIPQLERMIPHRFNVAMLDGNHEADYLVAELKDVRPLLAPNGFVVLDDVNENWSEIRDIYRHGIDFGYEPVGTDGRVGILQSQLAGNH